MPRGPVDTNTFQYIVYEGKNVFNFRQQENTMLMLSLIEMLGKSTYQSTHGLYP